MEAYFLSETDLNSETTGEAAVFRYFSLKVDFTFASMKKSIFRQNVELAGQLKEEILTKVPGALVDTIIGEDGEEKLQFEYEKVLIQHF